MAKFGCHVSIQGTSFSKFVYPLRLSSFSMQLTCYRRVQKVGIWAWDDLCWLSFFSRRWGWRGGQIPTFWLPLQFDVNKARHKTTPMPRTSLLVIVSPSSVTPNTEAAHCEAVSVLLQKMIVFSLPGLTLSCLTGPDGQDSKCTFYSKLRM